jgi:hypothetical protein
MSPSAGVLQATATGVLAATCAASAVLAGVPVVRVLLDRRRMRQWDEAWQQAGAGWGGKTF